MRSRLKLAIMAFSLLIGHKAIAAVIELNYKEIADAEVKAWQAYYQVNSDLLLERTGVLLSEQYHMQNKDAIHQVAKEFFTAYHKFATIPQNSAEEAYQKEVLPLVVKAYQSLKGIINAPWDAVDAANADLSWWIARRQDKLKDPELVGKRIELFYSILYGAEDKEGFLSRAGYLRALAARYRDLCHDQWGGVNDEDWKIIHSLLKESYLNLDKHLKVNHSS